MKEGRIESIEPNNTINTVAITNTRTERLAFLWLATSFDSYFLSLKTPSFRRFWYSGSSTNSFPTRMEKNAPTSTPMSVAGMVIFSISNRLISNPVSNPSSATVAADMGLAVMACCEAITAIPRGRSGRILVSVATSAITGSTE